MWDAICQNIKRYAIIYSLFVLSFVLMLMVFISYVLMFGARPLSHSI